MATASLVLAPLTPPGVRPDASWLTTRALLDSLVEAQGGERTALIPILHAAQQRLGHLAPEVQDYLATRLGVPSTTVHGVVTFYSFFKTQASGRHQANVCLGTACYVKGSARVLSELEQALGVKVGQTTPDGKVTLGACRCVGLCDRAPAVILDEDRVLGPVDSKQALAMLEGMD